MADVPHLSLPLRVIGQTFAVVDQDTVDELANNIKAVTSFAQGQRADDMRFGILPMPFDNRPLNLDDLNTTIAIYEPRADATVSEAPYDPNDPTAARVSIAVTMAGDEQEV